MPEAAEIDIRGIGGPLRALGCLSGPLGPCTLSLTHCLSMIYGPSKIMAVQAVLSELVSPEFPVMQGIYREISQIRPVSVLTASVSG